MDIRWTGLMTGPKFKARANNQAPQQNFHELALDHPKSSRLGPLLDTGGRSALLGAVFKLTSSISGAEFELSPPREFEPNRCINKTPPAASSFNVPPKYLLLAILAQRRPSDYSCLPSLDRSQLVGHLRSPS